MEKSQLPGVMQVVAETYRDGVLAEMDDRVAIEEPLEIQVALPDRDPALSVAVTMRTPGHDPDLALGFLYSEGAIDSMDQVAEVASLQGPNGGSLVRVTLSPGTPFDIHQFSRHVFTSSSCGVCGKQTIARLMARVPCTDLGRPSFPSSFILALPGKLRRAQAVFQQTGGLHAAALFDRDGTPLVLREDVGRHNALDKLVGYLLRENSLPLQEGMLMLSGRISFELVQKAVMAGIPAIAAVGAPSSLAVTLARDLGVTLIGFLRDGRFNRYL